MQWSLLTAANDQSVLERCLLASPCATSASEILVLRGFRSAGAAYNQGLADARSDVCVLAHQDVYLPAAWDEKLDVAIGRLTETDARWAVLGVFGICRALAKPVGHLYCTGLRRCVGRSFDEPVEVRSLDEVVLVVRRSAAVRFDEQLPGFHMYGTDICLTAHKQGMHCYAISAFCIHNTEGRILLPLSFWRAYWYMRRKWWDHLPIRTPCVKITKFGMELVDHTVRSLYARYVKGEVPGGRMAQPAQLAAALKERM